MSSRERNYKFKNKLAIIIPTKNREYELERLISSFSVQQYMPEQIIIVDASPFSNERIMESHSLPITYINKNSGISEARNIGISLLQSNIDLVCFLDDDVVLEENALSEMMSFWEKAGPDVGGCSFIITNQVQKAGTGKTFFKRLFFMESKRRRYGEVLSSGFNYDPYDPEMKLTYTDWLSGGVTVWRSNIFHEYSFDEWFSGYGAYEDVDFSYRVGKEYKLVVNPNARVQHLMDTKKIGNNIRIGKKEVLNRLYFVKKHPELSVIRSLWASMGELFSYVKSGNLDKAKGLLSGIGLYMRYGKKAFGREN